jgi:membrane protease YdiL (CAAX protease family)
VLSPTLADHVLAALVGLALPLAAVLRHDPDGPGELDRRERVVALWANSVFLWLTAGAACAAWWWGERPWPALGLALPRGGHAASLTLAVAFALGYALDTWSKVRTPAARARTRARILRHLPFLPREPNELPHLVVMALSAGVAEEIVFRGFLVSYVAALTGSGALGVALPAVVFGLSHRYQGWRGVVLVFGMAVGFGAIFVVSGSLLLPIVLHVAVDLFGGLLGIRLLREGAQQESAT